MTAFDGMEIIYLFYSGEEFINISMRRQENLFGWGILAMLFLGVFNQSRLEGSRCGSSRLRLSSPMPFVFVQQSLFLIDELCSL